LINHVRTLLLNRSGDSGASPQTPGEEYVPPAFRAKELPGFLSTALSAVFGNNPDRLYLNYRLRQIMQMLHATELSQGVLDFDSRITYDLDTTAFFDEVFQIEVNQYAGDPVTLYGTGQHAADDGVGRSTQQWLLTVMPGSILQVQRLTPPVSTVNEIFTVTNGLSNKLTLSGSQLEIQFHTPGVGVAWEITSKARPVRDLGDCMVRMERMLGADGTGTLLAGEEEPLITYRNLFNNNPVFAYKYGALMLAIATYIDGLPQVRE